MSRAVIALLFIPTLVMAHGLQGTAGLVAGMLHPVSGADHLLAMLGVGILSVQLGGHRIWQIPSLFVSGLLVGGGLGIHGCSLIEIELMVALSLVVLGALIAFADKCVMSPLLAFLFVSVFGLFHGNAHGLEIPAMATPALYVTGFVVVSIFIHVVGIFLAEWMSSSQAAKFILRLAGLGGSVFGFTLMWKHLFLIPFDQ